MNSNAARYHKVLQDAQHHERLLTDTIAQSGARVGGLRRLCAILNHILSWDDHIVTLLALCTFTLMCLYPLTLAIAPQLAIVSHLAVTYYDHCKGVVSETDDDSPESSVEYQDNLVFVQNFMDLYCDLYDTLVLFSRQYMNWNYPENVWTLVKLIMLSVGSVLTLFYYVPVKYIGLVSGWLFFVSSAPMLVAIRMTLTPILKDQMRRRWDSKEPEPASRWPTGITKVSSSPGLVADDELYVVAIYENQRWWFSLGFISHLLSSERTEWSEYYGKVGLPPVNKYSPPPGFQFVHNSEWQIERGWASVDPDQDGWVYTDHFWETERSSAGVGCITRRRKWTRQLIPIKNVKADSVPPELSSASPKEVTEANDLEHLLPKPLDLDETNSPTTNPGNPGSV